MPRPISTVHVTPDFEKAYLRLPKHIQNLATRKDRWFRRDAFDPRLRTHKLKGELAAYWAYSVNREYHVLFRFLAPSEVSIMMSALMRFIANIFLQFPTGDEPRKPIAIRLDAKVWVGCGKSPRKRAYRTTADQIRGQPGDRP
jgi:hypothetical protein